jgi:hypothetical protein
LAQEVQEETNKVAMKKSKLESADSLPLFAPYKKLLYGGHMDRMIFGE